MTIGNGTSTSYVDGKSVASADFLFRPETTDTIWIGAAENNIDRSFKGAIDDLRIYNYELTPEEVIDLYNANPALQDIAVCLYPINETLDFVDDCKIDLLDFAVFASGWLDCGLYPVSGCN